MDKCNLKGMRGGIMPRYRCHRDHGLQTGLDRILGLMCGIRTLSDPCDCTRDLRGPRHTGRICPADQIRHFGKGRFLFNCLRILAPFDQGNSLRLGSCDIFAPEPEQAAADHIISLAQQAVQAVHAQVDQQGIPYRDIELTAAFCVIDLLKDC